MSGFFSPHRRPTVVGRRLLLEALEARDCPSVGGGGPAFVVGPTPVDLNAANQAQQTNGPAGPYNVNFNYTFAGGHNVQITGQVTGPNAAKQVVEFQGPINGYVVTDANGDFVFTTQAASLTTIEAAVVPEGPAPGNTYQPLPGPVQSNVYSEALVDAAPVITSLTVTQLGNGSYEFSGTVTASYAAGLTVTFGGQPQTLQGGQTATVAANGTFQVVVNMVNGQADNGLATAQILADNWGEASNVATVNVVVS